MSESTPPFYAIVARQTELLLEERATHLTRIEEIDERLANAAKALGIDPSNLAPALQSGPRLPPRRDARSKGSLAEAIREVLATADRGYTRLELREEVRKIDVKFDDMVTKNVNSFYNAVKRGIDHHEIVDVDGALYASGRAPLSEGEPDPTGQHLPANVSLFPDRKSDAH